MGVDELNISQSKWGIKFFRLGKTALVILFTLFSFVVFVKGFKELDTLNYSMVGLLFVGNFLFLVLNLYLNHIYKEESDFERILTKINEKKEKLVPAKQEAHSS